MESPLDATAIRLGFCHLGPPVDERPGVAEPLSARAPDGDGRAGADSLQLVDVREALS